MIRSTVVKWLVLLVPLLLFSVFVFKTTIGRGSTSSFDNSSSPSTSSALPKPKEQKIVLDIPTPIPTSSFSNQERVDEEDLQVEWRREGTRSEEEQEKGGRELAATSPSEVEEQEDDEINIEILERLNNRFDKYFMEAARREIELNFINDFIAKRSPFDKTKWKIPKKFIVIGVKDHDIIPPKISELNSRLISEEGGWHMVLVNLKSVSSDLEEPPSQLYRKLRYSTWLDFTDSSIPLPLWATLFSSIDLLRSKEYFVLSSRVSPAKDQFPFLLARKNIGYLFAIFLGAELIVDGDESLDQIVNSWSPEFPEEFKFENPSPESPIRFIESFSKYRPIWRETDDGKETLERGRNGQRVPLVNHLKHFGMASIYPRGFPISENSGESVFEKVDGDLTYLPWLGLSATDKQHPREARVKKKGRTEIAVRQGLIRVRGDYLPNIKLRSVPADQELRPSPIASPIALEKGSFGILHSSNLYWSKSAFFGLLLPPTLDPRLADVWRGFVLQRVLWETDQAVAYHYSDSKRSSTDLHNPERIWLDTPLSVRTNNLTKEVVKTLATIEFPEEVTTTLAAFRYCWNEITKSKGIVEYDTKLIEAWFEDLQRLGLDETLADENRYSKPSPLPPPLLPPTTWKTPKSEEFREAILTFSSLQGDQSKPKEFLYLLSTTSQVNPLLRKLPSNADLIVFDSKTKKFLTSLDQTVDPFSEPDNAGEEPVDWSHSRDLLLQEMHRLEKDRGYHYKYVVYVEEGAKLAWTSIVQGKKPKDSLAILEHVQNRIVESNAAVFTISREENTALRLPWESVWKYNANNRPQDFHFIAFHRQTVDLLLPWAHITRILDLAGKIITFYPGHWIRSSELKVQFDPEQEGWMEYSDHLDPWESVPWPNFMITLYERDSGWALKTSLEEETDSELELWKGRRSYGDLCDCDWNCQASFCYISE